jgi:hypothetical protein
MVLAMLSTTYRQSHVTSRRFVATTAPIEMKRKVCDTCKRLIAGGVCFTCIAGAVVAGPVFDRIDPTPGSPTATFRMLTDPAPQIPILYPAAEDRGDPWHTEATSGLRTDVDYVTMGSVSTTEWLWRPKYPRLPSF